MKPEDAEEYGFGERFYRCFAPDRPGRVAFRVQVETTDLYLRADRDLSTEALQAATAARQAVASHILARPEFGTALAPLDPPRSQLPGLVLGMYRAALAAGVGPMAAVAGAVAAEVGRALRRASAEILVENGGDLYLDLAGECVVGLYYGPGHFGNRLGLRILPEWCPLGVCTSSGRIGPSLSRGDADGATVLAGDAALADAVATALGNRVRGRQDLEAAVEWARAVPGILGAVAARGDRLAAAGAVEFVEVSAAGKLGS